jgi:hypothetical protein
MGSIPSWDGPAMVTNTDSNIRSHKEVIVMHFNSYMEELAGWLLRIFGTLKL